jgi:hypothetical protein
MNGIICFGGKRGCVPVTIGEGGAVETLPERERDATGTHLPASGVISAASSESDDEPKLSPMKPFHPEPPAPYWPPARVARSPNLVRIPAGTPAEKCAGATCKGARIYKVKHPKTGKLTPAAVAETLKLTDGVIVPTGAFAPYLDAAPGRATIERDGIGYSHFIDCPDSKAFKRT